MGKLRDFIEDILTRRHGDDGLKRFNRMDKLVESAKRLHIIYTYEKKAYLTDIFRDTLRIINDDDFYWENYLHYLYKGDEKFGATMSVAVSMALALVSIHVPRTGFEPAPEEISESSELIADYLVLRAQMLNLTEEERRKGTELHREILDSQSEEWLKRQARTRHEWFNLFDFLVIGYPTHEQEKNKKVT